MLAVSAAKNSTPILHYHYDGRRPLTPNFTAMVAAGKPIALFGAIRLASYGGSVIPIILIVWFMSYVERFAEKWHRPLSNHAQTIIGRADNVCRLNCHWPDR